jgi:transposase
MYSNEFICLVLRLYNSRKETNLSINDILQMTGIANSTLFEWIKCYSHNTEIANCIKNPKTRPPKRKFNRRFFPKKIKPNCLKFIIDTVLEQKVINANNICKHIKNRFNVIISKRYLYKILKANNITYKVAQKVSYPYDQIKFEQQKQQLKETVNNVNHKLNFTNETSIYFNIKPNYGWSKKGQRCMIEQPKSYANKSPDRFSLVMTITNKKVINYSLVRGAFNAKRFKHYMTKTIPKMSDTLPFMDNARAHTAKIVKQYLDNHNKSPIFNVPYCPQFNPIEYLFNTLKAEIKRKTFKSESSIKRFLDKFIRNININGLDNYCNKAMNNLFND